MLEPLLFVDDIERLSSSNSGNNLQLNIIQTTATDHEQRLASLENTTSLSNKPSSIVSSLHNNSTTTTTTTGNVFSIFVSLVDL